MDSALAVDRSAFQLRRGGAGSGVMDVWLGWEDSPVLATYRVGDSPVHAIVPLTNGVPAVGGCGDAALHDGCRLRRDNPFMLPFMVGVKISWTAFRCVLLVRTCGGSRWVRGYLLETDLVQPAVGLVVPRSESWDVAS